MRRKFLTQMAAAAAGTAAVPVLAQGAYPSQNIRIIVAFAPGGSVDPIIRIIQPKLNEMLGQPIVIENRPGGTTSIAATAVTKSAPDGYTLFFTAANTHVIHTIGRPHIPYDALKDFTSIAAVSRSGYVFAIHPSIPANTIAEYVAYCKANPNKVSYASSGIGNANHLAMERFNLATGIRTTHVPYKAAATAYMDFLAGRVQAYFSTTSVLQPGIEAGQLRGLAYTATQEGDVPKDKTFTAAGLPEFETVDSLNIVLGPARMPPAVVARLESTIQKALGMADIKAAMQKQKQYAYFMSGAALLDRMTKDRVRYEQIIKDANIKLEG